jgi:metallo-beta-lactamase class B
MIRNLTLWLFCGLLLTACATTPAPQLALAQERAIPELVLEQIAEDVWIHKSYEYIEPWGPILSQGLIVKDGNSVIVVDTAWNNTDTERLLDLIEMQVFKGQGTLVPTHAHADKMGGMEPVNKREWVTLAFELTNEDAVKRSLTPARDSIPYFEHERGGPKSWSVGRVEFFYPGPGHTRDNIVAYDPKTKILFGGCLIRPGASDTLGNTADADLAAWADTVRRVAAEFPDAEIIIPSHGAPGDRSLLDHTIALAETAL